MNIVFDARVIQDHFPGIGRYAYNLLAALPNALADGDTLTVAYDPSTKNTRLPLHMLMARPDKRVSWREWRVPMFGAANALGQLPHGLTPAIAHFPYYVRPVRASMPSVTTIHDVLLLVNPAHAPSAKARLLNRLLNASAILASTRIIAVSRSAADDVARLFPFARGKVDVVPEAADPLFAPRDAQAQAAVRAKFGLPDRFALYLASNKPHKNLVGLVEAWRLVTREWRLTSDHSPLSTLQPPSLVVAGHVDLRYPQAQERAVALGIGEQVRFIGPVSDEDAAALYSACDVFVFPSLYEGFGLTPLEAMACGAPVVCSNTSSLPEVAGDAALLVNPAKPDDIAAACLRVLRDDALRADMRQRSLTQAAKFSWRDAAEHTISVYRAVEKLARS